jgi:N-acetylglucosaminyldiphosphoundecaprenol N-acetyl-beta-D-mannosaminyltransferase
MLLGCRVDDCDAAEAARRIVAAASRADANAPPLQVVTLGTEMIVRAQTDADFRAAVNGSGLSLCDTVGLLAASKLRGGPLRERVAGVELVEGVCAVLAGTPAGVYLLGGAPGVAEAAAAALRGRYPGLTIAGARDGYFADGEAARVAEAIRATGAALVLAGLGSPKQEVWLRDQLARSGCGAGIGIGGSFDVFSGKVPRAPRVWRALGLEWFYRLLREPWRWRRQLALPFFVFLVLRESVVSFMQRRSTPA